jgi:hypothetical protein
MYKHGKKSSHQVKGSDHSISRTRKTRGLMKEIFYNCVCYMCGTRKMASAFLNAVNLDFQLIINKLRTIE